MASVRVSKCKLIKQFNDLIYFVTGKPTLFFNSQLILPTHLL